MTLKQFLKFIVPPVFAHGYRKLFRDLHGNYSSWDTASHSSTGYDSETILEKAKAALLMVKNRKAIYERDSVLFDEVQYAWPLLAGLMWVAAKSGGKLDVLDFGGSLGSTYFQNLVFLDNLPEVQWNIVEQSRHVEVGKRSFEDDRLKFFNSIKDCIAATQPNVVILSSVLQYLEKPYDILSELMDLDCDHIIIDRTPFSINVEDRLCVQNVRHGIYPASYPCWIFSMTRFNSEISKRDFEIFTEFQSLDRLSGPVDLSYKGMIVVRSHARQQINGVGGLSTNTIGLPQNDGAGAM